jgi:hypothetical protein
MSQLAVITSTAPASFAPLFPAAVPAPQLGELKQELAALRVAKVTGGAPNKLSKM